MIIRSNADIENEDMADITDWTNADTGTGVSSKVTFDNIPCMKLFTGSSNGCVAKRSKDVGTFGTRTVLSLYTFFDKLGIVSADDNFRVEITDTTHVVVLRFGSNGLFFWSGSSSSYVEIGTGLVIQDIWSEYTFDVNWSDTTLSVYLNSKLLFSGLNFHQDYSAGNGVIVIRQQSGVDTNLLTYIGWIKVGTDVIYGNIDGFIGNKILNCNDIFEII